MPGSEARKTPDIWSDPCKSDLRVPDAEIEARRAGSHKYVLCLTRASAVYDGTGPLQNNSLPNQSTTLPLCPPCTPLHTPPSSLHCLQSSRSRRRRRRSTSQQHPHQHPSPTMNNLQRVLRPAARRIRMPLATVVVPTRWQSSGSSNSAPFDPVTTGEMGVGELEGAQFKIEPLRRTGEDPETMRARLTCMFSPPPPLSPFPRHTLYVHPLSLLYITTTIKETWRLTTGCADQSRKRGTLESDLLLSTFAARALPTMTPAQMREYDLFLDENDWDIYYWATQTESSASSSFQSAPATVAGALQSSEPYLSTQGGEAATTSSAEQQQKKQPVAPAKGEWAQTIGTFKPAYRPVPARWRDTEILRLLRAHVKERSAAGVLGNGADRERAEGMAFMPPLGERK